jgi:hypothetical protein
MLLVLMVTLFGTAALVAAAPSAGAASTPRLSWTMTVNGRDIGAADANKPLRLTPRTSPTIALQVTNLGSAPVRVRAARLEGRVLGLPFYSFTTRVDMQIAPGASDERRFSIDLLDLDGQATGLIPSRASLLDNDGNAIVSRSFAVDVRGSLGSVYGTFGLAVAAITLLLLVNALWRLLTGRLHPNRWRRGMTWAAPGLGVGFTLTFTLSALRLMVPGAGVWAALVILGGAIGFLIGYLTPTPERAHRDMSHDGRPWQPLEPPPGAGPGLPPVVDLREPAAPPRRRGAGQPTRPDRP